MSSVLGPWGVEDFHALVGSAFRIGCPSSALLGMLLSESDGYPGPALMHGNPKPNAVGLNQILLSSLHYVWRGSWQEYEALAVADQLPYVERWIRGQPGAKIDGARLYLSNFLPGYWQHGGEPGFVLCSSTRHPEWYTPNWPAFDPWLTSPEPKWPGGDRRFGHGEKGYITVGDLGDRIDRKLAEPRGRAFLTALHAVEDTPPAPVPEEQPSEQQISDELLQVLKLPPDIDVSSVPPYPPPGARKRPV